jgi:hypothetical protein
VGTIVRYSAWPFHLMPMDWGVAIWRRRFGALSFGANGLGRWAFPRRAASIYSHETMNVHSRLRPTRRAAALRLCGYWPATPARFAA